MSDIFRIKRTSLLAFTRSLTVICMVIQLSGCRDQHSLPPKTIPEPPPSYVLDETQVLNKQTLNSLESLLTEHEHLTGEQFLVGIFKSLEGHELSELTHQVFVQWKVGKQNQDKGVLLAIFLDDRKAKIETGNGLTSVLTDSTAKDILAHYSELGLTRTAYKILESLNSPLIQSEKFHALFQEEETPPPPAWGLVFIIGVALFLLVLMEILSKEAHFTRIGWYRPYFWRTFLRRRSQGNGADKLGGTHGSW